ncbi:hypothetical protein NE562_11520 [Butyricicoccus faecihominis]|uniref:hypothetical protein n=1 Tax=Butyricicoccus faecihominis TaxID=1712515 RepID=UPI002478FB32|nr:hypothetical protein [Butyricicoccus faecihominis]MCQ5130292.1 hypothetical protein [Butyricicoccus faecihominis]
MPAGYDGSIKIDTEISTDGFSKGVDDVQAKVTNIDGALGKLGKTIGAVFTVSAIKDFGGRALEAASDLQEVQNVVDTAFGGMAGRVEEFAKTSIEQFGMSELAAKQTASTYMAMSTGMGVTGQAAADMSLNMTALSADMASFYNVSQDVASTALKSVWTGETETLKQFGVVMTQTNLQQFAYQQGIQKNIDKMTQAEQVELRYKYVTEQLSLAQGDFAKTSDSWANQTRVLSEQINVLMGNIGTALIPLLQPVLDGISAIVAKLVEFSDWAAANPAAVETMANIILSLLAGIATYYTAKNIIGMISGIGGAFQKFGEVLSTPAGKVAALVLVFGLLVQMLTRLGAAWDSMSGVEKVAAALGGIVAVAFAAALAVGAFQSAITMGIAALAIVAGITAMTVAIQSAESKSNAQMNASSSSPNLGKGVTPYYSRSASIPKFATGAVIPPNNEFLAVLGDQKSGRNFEAPEGMLRQIVREESGGGSGVQRIELVLRPTTGFVRSLGIELDENSRRRGITLIKGDT